MESERAAEKLEGKKITEVEAGHCRKLTNKRQRERWSQIIMPVARRVSLICGRQLALLPVLALAVEVQ